MSPTNNNLEDGISQPLIAGVYARVSSGRQEQEATIESQLDEIKTRIKDDGNILPAENVFCDDGWSGEMLQRPGLDAFRDAIKAGVFQIAYCYDRGRISRKFVYQEIILEEIENLEIKFITLHDTSAETPEEKVTQAMQGVFHEYERIKIAERFRRGKLYKAKIGIMINGHSLYGYNYIKKTETVPAHYTINEEEAKVVRLIFEWVGIEKISLREVIKRLYDLGIPPRKRKREFWTKGPLTRLLRCETYAKGFAYFNKSESIVAKHPTKNIKYKRVKKNSRRARPRKEWFAYKVPVILNDNGLYEEVLKILSENQRFAQKNRKYNYLLTGRIFCGCGSPRAGDGSNKFGHHYYRCAERIYKFPKESKCKLKGTNAEVLDKSLWDQLIKFMRNPLTLKKATIDFLKFEASSNTQVKIEKEHLITSLGKLQDEEIRYAKAYGTDTLDFMQFQELMKGCSKQKASYQKQLDNLKNQREQNEYNPSKIKKLCDEARKVIESLDISNKILVIRDLIDKVIVKEDRKVEVWGHIPLIPLKLEYEPINRNCWFAQCW